MPAFMLILMGQTHFCLFLFFSHDKYSTNTINEKSLDGVHGTQTRGGMMVGADESTELWQHPICIYVYIKLSVPICAWTASLSVEPTRKNVLLLVKVIHG